MSNVKAEELKGTEVVESKEPVGLVDCGKASEVTKGAPFYWQFEGGVPPYNRLP